MSRTPYFVQFIFPKRQDWRSPTRRLVEILSRAHFNFKEKGFDQCFGWRQTQVFCLFWLHAYSFTPEQVRAWRWKKAPSGTACESCSTLRFTTPSSALTWRYSRDQLQSCWWVSTVHSPCLFSFTTRNWETGTSERHGRAGNGKEGSPIPRAAVPLARSSLSIAGCGREKEGTVCSTVSKWLCGNIFMTSSPSVSVRPHGHVNSAKVLR